MNFYPQYEIHTITSNLYNSENIFDKWHKSNIIIELNGIPVGDIQYCSLHYKQNIDFYGYTKMCDETISCDSIYFNYEKLCNAIGKNLNNQEILNIIMSDCPNFCIKIQNKDHNIIINAGWTIECNKGFTNFETYNYYNDPLKYLIIDSAKFIVNSIEIQPINQSEKFDSKLNDVVVEPMADKLIGGDLLSTQNQINSIIPITDDNNPFVFILGIFGALFGAFMNTALKQQENVRSKVEMQEDYTLIEDVEIKQLTE
jgi:hypothetical protein